MFALLVPLFASPILFAFAFAFPLANWTRVNIYFIYLLARPACGILEEDGGQTQTNRNMAMEVLISSRGSKYQEKGEWRPPAIHSVTQRTSLCQLFRSFFAEAIQVMR